MTTAKARFKRYCYTCGDWRHKNPACPLRAELEQAGAGLSCHASAELAPEQAEAELLRGEGSEPAMAFEARYRERVASAYPKGVDGSTLFPFTRFFLVARRPSLLEVYSEYAAYHDHQLTKGWKS